MSNFNISRAVANISSEKTSIYTPVIELVVNAIQAVECQGVANGKVSVKVLRAHQDELLVGRPNILGFSISDNGIGFTEEHRESFDTLYTDKKIKEGGKGFGRFVSLKYYDEVNYLSHYKENESIKVRKFSMGRDKEIIVNESIQNGKLDLKIGTCVTLTSPKIAFPEKNLDLIARRLTEKLLPYFFSDDDSIPAVVLSEEDDSNPIVLNKYVGNTSDSLIVESKKASGMFRLGDQACPHEFHVRTFKMYSPGSSRSRISLVAHRREVTTTSIHNYVPEFVEEFHDKNSDGEDKKSRNFIIVSYVTGSYLDTHVSLERHKFSFPKDAPSLYFEIEQKAIEIEAARFAKIAVDSAVDSRIKQKAERIGNYVRDEAPWYKDTFADVDYSSVPYNASKEQIEGFLSHQEFKDETRVKNEVRKLLAESTLGSLQERTNDITQQLTTKSKNELAHYIALRKCVLDLFEKSLEINADGKYPDEKIAHDIIFPLRSDDDRTPYSDHNLWIIDERLNFTQYLSSDKPLNGGATERPDIIAYNKRVSFRGENDYSNPVTIFEFKKPNRDDFINPSSNDDPVKQIVRYVNNIRKGKFQTPQGREILVADNTPFYGYIICHLNSKVKSWLDEEQDFTKMPDGLGYFRYFNNINLYIEVWSWDKTIRDASMRNKVLFKKLGID